MLTSKELKRAQSIARASMLATAKLANARTKKDLESALSRVDDVTARLDALTWDVVDREYRAPRGESVIMKLWNYHHVLLFDVRADTQDPMVTVMTETKRQKTIRVNASVPRVIRAWHDWLNGAYVQRAFDFLTPDEREFLMSGITPDEFTAMFPDPDDEQE